jgi:hypothetical protein
MEVQQNAKQISLMNFSFEEDGFEFQFLRDFEFDENFNQPDAGQIQDQPNALDEKDLLIRLRDKQKRDSALIPPTIYAFYDNCKKYFVEEFMSLLTGLFSNIEKAQTMQDHLTNDRLLDFFSFELKGTLNFGKHQVFVDSAAECEAETKVKLIACGKEIQQLVHTGREKAADAARSKLRACSDDFKTFGENEWITQCKKTSLHNILDQHFAVKCQPEVDDAGSSDEFDSKAAPFKLWTASTWLYNAAIHDSKKEIDKEIRRRRAQKIKAEADAAALRARQAAVDIRADAVKPEMLLQDRFKLLDDRLNSVDDKLSTQEKRDDDPTLVQKLRKQVMELERKLRALPDSAPLDSSKNDTRAGSAETQQPAEKGRRRRPKRPRAEAADATADEEDSPKPATHHALKNGQQRPRPPALNHASGNERTTSQQQRGVRFGQQQQKRDQEATDDSATPQPKARKQQDDAQSQATWNRNQQGRGRGWNHHGRGRGRGQGRGREKE